MRQASLFWAVLLALLLVEGTSFPLEDEAASSSPSVNHTMRVLEPMQRFRSARQDESLMGKAYEVHQNEIDSDDGRIEVAEPFKSMMQTTTRFALANAKLPKHISIDTAMGFLNDVFYMLSTKRALSVAVKLITSVMAAIIGISILFPQAMKSVQSSWDDPAGSLNFDRYLSNGLSEKSVLDAATARTDEALNRIGFPSLAKCGEPSLCQFGKILHCFLPKTSQAMIRFGQTHFSSLNIREHPLANAFLQGFVDQNCTKVEQPSGGSETSGRSGSCWEDFFSSFLNSSSSARANTSNKI